MSSTDRSESAPLISSKAWESLDRYMQALEQGQGARAQAQHSLRAVRAAVAADAAFLCSPFAGKPAEVLADEPLGLAWCRRLLRWQLARHGPTMSGHWLMSTPAASAGAASGEPYSVLMVCLSKSRSLWLVALSFNGAFAAEDLKVMLLIRRILLDHRQKSQTHSHLTDAIRGVVHGMNEAIAAKSPFTHGHSERVARMAVRLGRQMGLPRAAQSDLYLAGLLHDIGKIGIRDTVLQKPGPLDENERRHMGEHPLIGDRIVAGIKLFAHLRPGVRNHHEHFDGTGYPDGLAGAAIPLMARILAVVDACDAMMSARPYRPGLGTERIDAIMRAGAGRQWDPAIVEHFLACRQDLYDIHERGIGDSLLLAVQHLVRAGRRWPPEYARDSVGSAEPSPVEPASL
jgi:HD-GYP domain-containing protein (c-di-GMP phosphodiesterase class II)